MQRKLYLPLKLSPLQWRVALCLLLTALFFYNPFLTIYGASQIPNVQHPLSYRATVAGSELQTCTVEPARPLIPALEFAVVLGLIRAAVTNSVPLALPGDTFRALPQVICNSLWFRPPPVS
jgi:hypothetical protein